ncbi:hypothetical protein ACVWW1_009326 [Bradyrhizobium sp. JR3.5]
MPEGSVAAVAAGAGLRHRAAQRRDDRRQVQAQEEHLHHHPCDGAAPRSLGLGPEPRCVRSREFQPRGGGQAPDQRLEAVRQRAARLHRPRFCHARGGARDRHDPAALQTARRASLPDAPEGDADRQARRLQDQGAAARRQGSRRVRRQHGRRCGRAEGTARADHAPRSQHADAGALRLQPRLGRGAGDPHGGSVGDQRLRHPAWSAGRLCRQAAGGGAAS